MMLNAITFNLHTIYILMAVVCKFYPKTDYRIIIPIKNGDRRN